MHVAGMLRGGVQGEDKGCWKYDDYSVTSETGGPFGSTQYTFDHVFGGFALATVSAVCPHTIARARLPAANA